MSTTSPDVVAGSSDPATRLVGRTRWIYEALMVALALVVVATLPLGPDGWVRRVNLAVWAVFVLDYLARLALSDDRRRFFRHRWLDLIAILPLDLFRAARVLRLARLVRLIRAGTVLWRVSADVRGVLRTNGLAPVLAVSSVVVLAGAVGIWLAEPGIDHLPDALWWSVVTATTVGYGDLSPETSIGRVVAVALMLVGIGTIGMITGSIATYFIGTGRDEVPAHVGLVRRELDRWPSLTPSERRRLAALLTDLAAEPDPGPVGPGG